MIKLLIILDNSITYKDKIQAALELQRKDYLLATDNEVDMTWKYIKQDLSNLPWEVYGYGDNNYGVKTSWIKQDTSLLYGTYRDTIDSVAYVIDDSHWITIGNQNIYGWNLGAFYPVREGYQVQLIRATTNVQWLYYTFLMEFAHSLNDFALRDMGVYLEETLNVKSWDEDIIHDRHPDYEPYKYVDALRKIKPILLALFNDNMLTKEQLEKLYNVIFHRSIDDGAFGYVGKSIDFVLGEFEKSKEWQAYHKVYAAVKENFKVNL